jgi:hypothetical protein
MNSKDILAESASRRIMFVALLGVVRELIMAYMDKVVFEDKYIIRNGQKALNRMFRHFDKDGLSDNPYYDKLVEDIVEHIEMHREYTENELKNRPTEEE